MRALIIAAGMGNRLEAQTKGTPKCLLKVGNRSLIEAIFGSLHKARITDAVIVTGFQGDLLEKALGNGHAFGMRLTYVPNEQWEKSNGISVNAARSEFKRNESFLLMMSDHLVSSDMIKRVAAFDISSKQVGLAVDKRVANIFDIEDATKVVTNGPTVRQIGKGLVGYNGIDCGLFKCSWAVFEALDSCLTSTDDCSLTDAGRKLAAEGNLMAIDIGNNDWLDVDTPAALNQATKLVREGIF